MLKRLCRAWVLLCGVLLLSGCLNANLPVKPAQTETPTPAPTVMPSSELSPVPQNEDYQQLDMRNQEWITLYNKKRGDVGSLYLENAVLVTETENGSCSSLNAASFFKDSYSTLEGVSSIEVIARFVGADGYIFEMGLMRAKNGKSYQYVTIWQKGSKDWFKEFEAIYEKKTEEVGSALDESREQWLALSGSKDIGGLVQDLYDDQAIFYTRNELIQGRKELRQKFEEMAANQSFKEMRSPGTILFVWEDLAYEIGSTEGDLPGHYLFIWKKNDKGFWRVLLESTY